MSKPRKYKSLAESLAEVDTRKFKEFDPEGFGTAFENDKAKYDDDESESSVGEDAGRGHYVSVGKSKLRKPEEVDLGREYTGAKVSRENVFGEDDDESSEEDEAEVSGESEEEFGDLDGTGEDEEIESDEAFGEDDEEKFKDFTFRGSKNMQNGADRHVDGMEDLDLDDEDSEDGSEEETDGLSDGDDQDDSDMSDEETPKYPSRNTNSELESAETRAKLRELMATEQQNVVGNIAQAVKDDALKGQAVKKQRGIFDTFLNTRIRLQKALIAANTLALPSTTANRTGKDHLDAAEQAALNLYNSMTELRSSLDGRSKKRSFLATQSTSFSELESHLSSLEEPAKQRRRITISKWAEKTAPIATIDPRNRLIKPTSTSLLDILDVQLMEPSLSRLRKRTRTARSCAPSHLESGIAESNDIYDDADWYALLLRELVETKMISSTNTAALGLGASGGPATKLSSLTSLQRATKTKKPGLDVKASKGRKLKFNVHEKLLNFMAPEDRGSWGERQVEEFFGSLLGRRVRGGLGEDVDVDSEEDAGESALRLFRT